MSRVLLIAGRGNSIKLRNEDGAKRRISEPQRLLDMRDKTVYFIII